MADTDGRPFAPPIPAMLVLASRSPRRRQLLARAGVRHEAIDPGVDDGVLRPGPVTPEAWVAALAYLKAAAGAARAAAIDPSALLLGADTVCVAGGEIIGQPRDADDAERILRRFEGSEHRVITGVALVRLRDGRPAERLIFADGATVRVGDLGDRRRAEYLASGRWRGKAGAYNLEDAAAEGWPVEARGDPATVMGLPMRRLGPLLAAILPARGAGEPRAAACGAGGTGV